MSANLLMPLERSCRAALAILAGGRGSRMGQPKAWLKLRGRPILDYLLYRFAWPGPTVLVTAPGLEHPPGFERFTVEATDAVAGQGPLRGLVTALEGCARVGAPFVVVTTVDMPAVESAHLRCLAEYLDAHPAAAGCLPVRRVEGREQVEPFPCAVRLTAIDVLLARLDKGEGAVHSLVASVFLAAPVPADWPDRMWINLNWPEELAEFEESLP